VSIRTQLFHVGGKKGRILAQVFDELRREVFVQGIETQAGRGKSDAIVEFPGAGEQPDPRNAACRRELEGYYRVRNSVNSWRVSRWAEADGNSVTM
jgi:hypothetical protein